MKKILIITISIFLIGCTQSSEEEKSYLTEKQECFAYRDFAKAELVYGSSPSLTSYLETLFYSPVLDTCVAVINVSYYFEDGETKTDVVYWDVLKVTVLNTFIVSYYGENTIYPDIVEDDLKRLREYRTEIGVPFN